MKLIPLVFLFVGLSAHAEFSMQLATGHGLPAMYEGTIRAADFDGDEKLDVLMSGFTQEGAVPGGLIVKIFKNVSTVGNIKFQLMHDLSNSAGMVSDSSSQVDVGDFDGDGDIDFVFEGAYITIAINNGSSFSSAHITNSNGSRLKGSRMIATGDISGDGRADIATSRPTWQDGSSAPLYFSFENGRWVENQVSFKNDLCGGGMRIGDIDNDGLNDIIVGGNCYSFGQDNGQGARHVWSHWQKNVGGAIQLQPAFHFAEQSGFSTKNGMDNGSYVIDDFDGDGLNDIGIAGSHEGVPENWGGIWNQYDFAIFYNDKNSPGDNFTVYHHPDGAGNQQVNGISSGDLNGDGAADAFYMGHYNSGGGRYQHRTELFLSDPSTRTMIRTDLGLPVLGQGNGAIADFDGDGKKDLVYAGSDRVRHPNATNNDGHRANIYFYRNTNDQPVDRVAPKAPGNFVVQ